VHKVASLIQFQHTARPLIAVTGTAYVHLQSLYAVVRASAWYAAVAILYKQALKHLVGIVVVQMVKHTIGELRSKNLTLFWAFHYKTA
jgi:hypothetical protein